MGRRRTTPTLSIRKHLMFDLATLNISAPLIEAELRIYKSKARLRKHKARGVKTQLLEIHVYQVEKLNGSISKGKLLDARRVSSHSIGWEVFFVKSAVQQWMMKPKLNNGLLVTLRNMFGEELETKGILRIRGRHMQRFEPTLILYNGERQHPSDYGQHAYGYRSRRKRYKAQQQNLRRRLHRKRWRRNQLNKRIVRKRSTDVISGQCKRHKLVVDFEKIGWANWIISPKSYNAYYCKGSCPFPLGQNLKPTNHATVQSIVRGLGLTDGVTAPCCVPNKLYSISLLYYDDHGNVVLKQYDDMVAGSCGCH
ncbi:Bone morphogenetic protein 7 [Nymphon striatum]|nr:Bone morphogenetic protein 7 [Nymphon striatum]